MSHDPKLAQAVVFVLRDSVYMLSSAFGGIL
jgi:hypothetical protein